MPDEKTEPKGVLQKLHRIMEEVGYLQKNQKIEYGNTKYTAVTETAVLQVIRPKLVEYGLVLLPILGNVVPEQSSKGAWVTTVDVSYKIVDVETGEFETLWSTGQGHDSADKGAGKAFTYATKYLLLKMFLLETGDDPDQKASDQSVAEETNAELQTLRKEVTALIKQKQDLGAISDAGAQRTLDGMASIKGTADEYNRLLTLKSNVEKR